MAIAMGVEGTRVMREEAGGELSEAWERVYLKWRLCDFDLRTG